MLGSQLMTNGRGDSIITHTSDKHFTATYDPYRYPLYTRLNPPRPSRLLDEKLFVAFDNTDSSKIFPIYTTSTLKTRGY